MVIDLPEISLVIVDDEREACSNLQNMLNAYIDEPVTILGIAHNTRVAEELITLHKPQAVFLDIEMPNENAFEFLARLPVIDFEVIFVTAYDEYAVRAFKLNAVDYILKPISITELAGAVRKLKERLRYKALIAGTPLSLSDLAIEVTGKQKNNRITLRSGGDIEVVEFKNIYFAEAQGSYTKIVFAKGDKIKDIVLSSSLAEYEELFPDTIFYRIHKSYLINCGHVKKIIKGEVNQVVTDGDFTLPVSRRRYAPLLDFLKTNNYGYE
jgi:two-component system LytT family response regulator